MSVTMSDLLRLPSLRQAKVLGGAGGLKKVVSSISVLESTDPGVLVHELFPQDKYSGGEIVITGFLNCREDVERQCLILERLAEGGEVGLVLYYVGIYMPYVDQKLIDLANERDFVLICMPEGQKHLRYSELISDVTEYIYQDRRTSVSLVSDILARISSVPHHQQTVGTALQMLCAQLSCSVVLCTSERRILNLSTWPSGLEDTIRSGMEQLSFVSEGELSVPCPFLSGAELYSVPIRSDLAQSFRLFLIKEGAPFNRQLIEQAADVTRICINIWGRQHGEVAIHELIRAILQDEPLKMRRLAEIFHINIAAIHELWMLCGVNPSDVDPHLEEELELARECAEIAIGAVYEGTPILFLSTPRSLRETERVMQELLSHALKKNPDAVIVRCGSLSNTTSCRHSYLLTLENLEDAKRIYPQKKIFLLGELELAAACRKRIAEGEAAALKRTLSLSVLQSDGEDTDLLHTLCVYLLDCDSSVTGTAEALYLHKNTIKYRLQKISDLLGFRLGKMPETMELYRSAAIYRLLHETHHT